MKSKLFLIVLLFALITNSSWAAVASTTTPSFESGDRPEIERQAPIKWEGWPKAPSKSSPLAPQSVAPPALAPEAFAPSLGSNLIQNPQVETLGANGLPEGWFKGGYGVNNRTLTYPAAGANNSKGLQVSITSYSSGDAKWYFADVPVTAGKNYQFSDLFISDGPSTITARFTLDNGSFVYKDLTTLGAQSSFSSVTVPFTPPAGAVSVTIFHLISRTGTLTTDDFSLNEVGGTPPDQNNLVPNPGFEVPGANGLPQSWFKGGYGVNTRTFSYPVSGMNGGSAAKVSITSYSSGDAKWWFSPVVINGGSSYVFSDYYSANVGSIITAQFQNSNGTISYLDLGSLPPVTSFTPASFSFTAPALANKVTVFHLIKGVGSLTIDNVSLMSSAAPPPPPPPSGIFNTGAVSLRFDDAWLSQYQNALPKLTTAGFRGTFYVPTRQLSDYGFVGYMSKTQIKNLASKGHEIGSHTQKHTDLTTLSSSQAQTEIVGSRQDLQAMNVGPVNSLAYPFGAYDSTIIAMVRDAGFKSAAATIGGDVTPNSDRYQLERRSVEVSVTVPQIKSWIDQAVANKEWLILTFHEVSTSGRQYSITPANFNQVIDYLKQKNVPVVTISQGAEFLP